MPEYPTEYRFCPQCGRPLNQAVIFGQTRAKCPVCSFVHWGEFSIGVGGVLWRDNKVLLVQRAYNPGKGIWTIPGGYVDQDERIEDAIGREIEEETGVNAEAVSFIALRDRPGPKHDAYIVFLMNDLGGELKAQKEEVSNIGFFALDECRQLPIASLSLNVIESTLTGTPGFHKKEGVRLIGESAALYGIANRSQT